MMYSFTSLVCLIRACRAIIGNPVIQRHSPQVVRRCLQDLAQYRQWLEEIRTTHHMEP